MGLAFVGVNLAAKGTFLEEIWALFLGTTMHSFEFLHYRLEFRGHIFEFWFQIIDFCAKFSKNFRSKG